MFFRLNFARIATAFLSCTFFLLESELPVAAQARHAKSNIVFILTDDQRLDDVQYMKNVQDRIIKNGVTFKNYFDTVALCCPSRSSILRGQYAHNTGVKTNTLPDGGFEVAYENGMEKSTVATWLHDFGYSTALFGKYLNGYPGPAGPDYIPPGWDNWAVSVHGNPYSEYNYRLNENGKFVDYGATAQDYGTDVYAGKALKFIADSAKTKKPFFLYLAVYAPHGPATVAPRYQGMFGDVQVPRSPAFNQSDVSKMPQFIQRLPLLSEQEITSADRYRGKRLASLQAVDEAIGKIFKTLEETGELANTYVVFTSDNGFHLGEHRMRRGKQTAYDTDIHLPLYVLGPGVKAGKVVDELVGNVDLAPTFAELAGAPAPAFVDGRSLAPFLHGGTTKVGDWRQCYLVEHWDGRKGRKATLRQRRMQESAPATQAATTSSASPAAPKASEIVEEETIEGSQPEAMQPQASVSVQTPVAAPGPGGRGRKRRAGANRELGGIPEFHAIRTADSLYTEYVTGEREVYKLDHDPSEISNLATAGSAKESAPCFDRITALKASAGKNARQLESAH
jgi:N-acetylglucosamine-6-sulfatase